MWRVVFVFMKRIAVIQFRTDPALIVAEQEIFHRQLSGEPVELLFLNALDTSLDWHAPASLLTAIDAIILGGSGDMDFDGGNEEEHENRKRSRQALVQLTPLLTEMFARNMPTLGICFGHQLIGAFKGAKVVNDSSQMKNGTFEVSVCAHNRSWSLLKDIPESLPVQYGHKDALAEVPQGAQLIFQGEKCRVAGLSYSETIYSVQFHPELECDDMMARAKNIKGYLPEHVSAASVFKASPDAHRILLNFVRYVA